MASRIKIINAIMSKLIRKSCSRIGRIILFVLIVVCSISTAVAQETTQDMDIGLRLRDDGENVPIAVRPEPDCTSPFRIHKGAVNYCIGLVDTSDPLATNARIKLPTGEIKALQIPRWTLPHLCLLALESNRLRAAMTIITYSTAAEVHLLCVQRCMSQAAVEF